MYLFAEYKTVMEPKADGEAARRGGRHETRAGAYARTAMFLTLGITGNCVGIFARKIWGSPSSISLTPYFL